MKLIDILVRELPERGGWPETASTATQDSDGEICFSSGGKHEYCITSWKGGKWTGDGFMAEHAIDYEISIISREQYEAALASSKPEWDGEGLPPVGSECEIVDKDGLLRYGHGESGEVIAHIENTAVIRMSYALGCFNAGFLRPIRSEADKKRDSIISMIEKAYKDCPHSDAVPQAIYEAIAEHIRID
ncbi:hypothetical protein N8Q41_15115 [Enterobacter hormaechei subsp. steigerwaltii]|uniref:hypothetical protein n=1 Tax=Enterobacter hormaechei TaxID=158836 RepID=UPI0023AF46B7|nr:hypothetical protein [Enterobacter hormaechei]MCU2464282.1 hypothetical protein [Enterobacter hormaechei subsp. steigerwaltii]EKY3929380.1 hypothetical protein [Enterobacter hormaechei]ELD3454394.1 hypothetical protein [Enterobacter hormaechei]MDE7890874.1 hypothetical protein [Enterobacter hormaechei]MDS0945470.1 hypothetical protein [Enterobacter hormaechei]